MPKPIPLPHDFTAVASSLSNSELIDRYDVAYSVIRRWRKETGVNLSEEALAEKIGKGRPKMHIPPDLAATAARLRQFELASHYRVNRNTVRRWLVRAQINAVPFREPKPKIHRERRPNKTNFILPKVEFACQRDTSSEGMAAEHLRCATRAAIYRCDEHGRADQNGSLWRYGNIAITRRELIARAEKHGMSGGG